MRIQASVTPVYSRYSNNKNIYNNNNLVNNKYATAPQQSPAMVRCPHGNPGGSCPLCLGMGGGGGGGASKVKPKPTPKELGLLTWADLLPVWYAMQAAKRREQYNQKMEQLNALKKALKNSQIYQTINNFVNTKVKPVLKLLNIKVLKPTIKNLQRLNNAIKTLYTELKNQVMQQLSKLAVVNEKAHQLLTKLAQSMDVFKAAMEKFLASVKEKEKAIKEYFDDLKGKFKKKLYRIIEAAESLFNDRKKREGDEKVSLLEELDYDD